MSICGVDNVRLNLQNNSIIIQVFDQNDGTEIKYNK